MSAKVKELRSGPARRGVRLVTLGIAALAAIIALGLVSASWRTIDPGYVGIVFDKVSRQVSANSLDPGWQFINPFTQSIQQYPVTIQTYAMVQAQTEGSQADDDSIKVQSSEGQQVNLDTVIQYQVIKAEAADLFQDWGGAPIETVEDSVVRQYTRSQVPLVASLYGWEDISATEREKISNEIAARLESEFARRHLQLVSFGIREVHLPRAAAGGAGPEDPGAAGGRAPGVPAAAGQGQGRAG